MNRIPNLLLLWALTGCSANELSGVYSDELGTTAYDFRHDQRVFITVLEITVAADYTTHGDDIIVTTPQGTLVLARHDDRLIGPSGRVFTRRSNG